MAETDAEKILRAKLRFEVDKAAADAASAKTRQLKKEIQDLNKEARVLSDISRKMAGFGAVLAGPLLLAARQYVDQSQRATKTTRDWKAATEEITKAQMEIGKVAAQAALPILRTVADLATKAAKFAQEHPDVIRAAINIGTVVATLGAVGLAVSRGVKLVADVKTVLSSTQNLLAGKMMKEAADKQAAAAAQQAAAAGQQAAAAGAKGAGSFMGRMGQAALSPGGLAAGIAGIGLGEQIYHALGGDKNITFFNTVGKGVSALAGGITSIFEGAERGAQVTTDWGRGLGLVEDQAEKTDDALEGLADEMKVTGLQAAQFSNMLADAANKLGLSAVGTQFREAAGRAAEQDPAVQAFVKYREKENELTVKYEEDRLTIINDANTRAVQAHRNYEHQRIEILQRFHEDDTREQETYYEDRLKRAADFGQETLEMEQDHQREMRRMKRDSDERLNDAARSRDALAYLKEQRDYEKKRGDAEEDYNVAAARRNAAFAREMADMEKNFVKQRESRLIDQQKQLDELKKKQDEENEQIKIDKSNKLSALNVKLTEEQAALRKGFGDQLRDLDAALLGEQQTKAAYYAAMAQDLQAWLQQYRNQLQSALPGYSPTEETRPRRGGRQVGGYTVPGLYNLHGGEFVANARTARAMEQIAGGLTQDKLMNMASGRSGGSSITIQQNFTFEGTFTEGDRANFRREAYDQALRAVNDAHERARR